MTEIRRIADAIATGATLEPADRDMVADVLRRIDNGESAATAIYAAKLDRRDALLRQIWRRHYADLRVTRASETISTTISQYQTTAWKQDRLRSECPYPFDSLRAIMWSILRITSDVPKQRQILTILSYAADPPSDCANDRGP